jgi:heme/copper-type cytochrome/quinol oxidase subunit 4
MRKRGHFSRGQWALYAAVVAVAIIVAVVVGEMLK